MPPIFALITVFLESLGSLHIFAILGSILSVGGSRKGKVPAFLNLILPLVIGLVIIFLPRWVVCDKLLPGSFVPDY
jgi:hypothetical protein